MATAVASVLALVALGCTSTNPAYESTADGGFSGSAGSTGSMSETTTATSMSTTTGTVPTGGGSMTSPTTDGSTDSSTSVDTTPAEESSEAGGSTGPLPLSCDRALWVTGDVNVAANGDTPFYERLTDLGFSATVVQNAASQTEDVGDNCLVVLSPLGSASDVEDKFRAVTVPLITWEYNLYDNLRMVDPLGTGWGIDEMVDEIEIVDPTHPLAAGLAGLVPVYSGGGRISWGMPVGDVQIVARAAGDPTHVTIFAFEQGAAMADGFVAPARRVALGGGETAIPVTGEAVELFEAAVRWAVE